ncbi:hypothetical protein KJ781_00245 [Patescibacteria group bacterium]|nr:hypothetical protein [Patescibacteria group bacterium]MBU1448317.1 hypothetical protein [Patescibacteria group bacterium]MBU2612975.1 hypothetical protein [Patescibacteria group bacterium]
MAGKDPLGPWGLALQDIAQLMAKLSNKLSGEDRLVWLEAFRTFLRGKNPWPVSADGFDVWKHITVTYKPSLRALSPEQTRTLNLVLVTPHDLGIRKGVTMPLILMHAKRLGLGPIPQELGKSVADTLKKKRMDTMRLVLSPIPPKSDPGIIRLQQFSASEIRDGSRCRFTLLSKLVFVHVKTIET